MNIKERTIEFHGPLYDFFWDEDSKICLLEGAAGTGKTFCYLNKVFMIAEENPGVRIVLSRKERSDLGESVLEPFENDVLPPNHPSKPGRRDAQRARRLNYRFDNGSEIFCYGMTDRSENDEEDASKFKSTQFDIWCIEEATECTFDEMQIAFSRLRADGITWKQLILAFNPPSDPEHHIYRFIGKPGVTYYKTVHEDNPKYWTANPNGSLVHPVSGIRGEWTPKGKQYKEEILGILEGNISDRFASGKNAFQPGLVHPEFSMQRHTVNEPDKTFLGYVKSLQMTSEQKTWWIRNNFYTDLAIDWGVGHPLVMSIMIKPREEGIQFDGLTWKYRQIAQLYRTGIVADEGGKEVLRYCGYEYDEDSQSYSYIDNDLGFVIPLLDEEMKQSCDVVTDHALESRVLFTRGTGLDTILACKTIDAGLKEVSIALREDQVIFDTPHLITGIDYYQNRNGKPTGIHMEFAKYKLQKGPQGYGKRPIPQNDDGCTALRYWIAEQVGLRDKILAPKDYRGTVVDDIDVEVYDMVVEDQEMQMLFGRVSSKDEFLF